MKMSVLKELQMLLHLIATNSDIVDPGEWKPLTPPFENVLKMLNTVKVKYLYKEKLILVIIDANDMDI